MFDDISSFFFFLCVLVAAFSENNIAFRLDSGSTTVSTVAAHNVRVHVCQTVQID